MTSIGTVYKIICSLSNDIYVGSTFNTIDQRFATHKTNYKNWKNGILSKCSVFDLFDKYGIENFRIIKIKEYTVCRDSQRDTSHLRVYEQLWINKLRPVNLYCAFNPLFKECAKRQTKEYYKKNKDKIIVKCREYYETNKDTIKINQKEYYETNKDVINIKKKEYYETNKDAIKINQKIYNELHKDAIKINQKEYNKLNKDKIQIQRKKWREDNNVILKAKRKKYKEDNIATIQAKQKEQINCICGNTFTKSNRSQHMKSKKHQSYIAQN